MSAEKGLTLAEAARSFGVAYSRLHHLALKSGIQPAEVHGVVRVFDRSQVAQLVRMAAAMDADLAIGVGGERPRVMAL